MPEPTGVIRRNRNGSSRNLSKALLYTHRLNYPKIVDTLNTKIISDNMAIPHIEGIPYPNSLGSNIIF